VTKTFPQLSYSLRSGPDRASLNQEINLTTLHDLRGHHRDSLADTEAHLDSTSLVVVLFEQYHAAVFAYLYRLVGDREWAHDLTQETFLRLFHARSRLPQVKNRRAWIYRIATNLAFNALKRQRRFAWLPWRSTDAAHLIAPDPTEESERSLAVERALAQLPPGYRAPLLLHSHYGFSVQEVAQALNISQGAVKTRLYRAREMFRQVYEGEDIA
jgi:RNA polymerase sigma-70 factor (ECF subfamily)